MQKEQAGQLVSLDDLNDFKVAKDDPDVRGWDVVAADRQEIGEVKDLIVDRTAMKVRYLAVELHKEFSGKNGQRQVLVPVGRAKIDEEEDQVLLALPSTDVASLPEYERGYLSREYEDSVRQKLDRTFSASSGGEREYYEHEDFDAERFYGRGRSDEARITRSEEELAVGKQSVQAGEVGIRKRVETEDVSVPVTKLREEVEIERRPIKGGAEGVEIGEDELRVPVMEEEVVVQKRPVVKEEVIVRKRTVEEEGEVRDTIRKERIDVDEPRRPAQPRKGD